MRHKMRMVRDLSLRRQMTLYVLIIIVVAFAIFSAANIWLNLHVTSQQLHQTQRSNIRLIENDIDANLSLIEHELASIGHFYLSERPDLASVQSLLHVKTEENQVFDAVWLMNGEGLEVVRVEDSQVIPRTQLLDRSEWEYFFKATRLPPDESYFSAVRSGRGGLIVTLSQPLYDGPAFSGVIAASLRFTSIDNILDIVSAPEGIQIHLLDADGRLIATSDERLQANLMSFVFLPSVQAIVQDASPDGVAAYDNMLGQQVYGTASRIRPFDWIVVIEQDRSVVLNDQLRAQSYSLLAGAIISLIAMGLSFAFSQQIAGGVNRVLEKTKRMRAGDLTSPIEVSGSKELVALADSFGEMALQLDTSMKNLESRIADQEETEKTLRQRSRELELLLETTRTLTRERDISAQLHYAASTCLDLLNADECTIHCLLMHEYPDTTVTRIEAIPHEKIILRLFDHFIRPASPAYFNNIEEKPQVRAVLGNPEFPVHLVSAPLFAGENRIGEVLVVRLAGEAFEDRDLNLFRGIVRQISQALESAMLLNQLEEYNNSLEEAVTLRTKELRAANENLRQLSQMKDEFISNISHELRTPLTNLKLHAYLLSQRPESPQKHLVVFERETERLQAIVENLLTISSLEQAQTDFHLEPMDINELVRDVAADREMLVRSAGKYFDVRIEAEEGLELMADRRLLEQVISVLLTNAMAYTPESGRIIMRTHSRNVEGKAEVGFSVEDNGIGIRPDEQEHVFDRFYRGHAAGKVNVPGTGLGLAIACQIIERHHGVIELSSSGVPGEITRFTVWLPLGDHPKG